MDASQTRYCHVCGEPLPFRKRAHAFFCSAGCRLRYHRARDAQQAGLDAQESVSSPLPVPHPSPPTETLSEPPPRVLIASYKAAGPSPEWVIKVATGRIAAAPSVRQHCIAYARCLTPH